MERNHEDTDLIRKEIDQWNSTCEILWREHKFIEAINLAYKSYNLSSDINYKQGQADASRCLGTIFSMQSKNIEAKEFLEKALNYYIEVSDNLGSLRCHTNLGIINGNTGHFQFALDHFYNAMQLSEKENQKKYLAEQYLNVGSIYRKLRNLDKSFDFYKKSASIKKEINDEIGLAAVFNNIGNLYRLKKDDGLALGYFKKANKIWEKHNYKRGMATVLNNISTILISKRKYDEAIQYIEKQLIIAISLDLNTTIALAFINLALIYIHKEQFNIAEDFLNSANQIANNINDKELKLFYLETKSKLHICTQDFQTAYHATKEILDLKDALFDERLSEKITEIESSFMIKQKEQEKELYRLKNVELVNAFNEIESQKEQLSTYNEKLEIMDKSKDAILRIVSHDLKNLIGSISSVLDLLKYEELPEKIDSYLNIIDQSTLKALQLLKDLLDSNSIEMFDYKLDLERSNIVLVLENYKYAFSTEASKKSITFSLLYSDDEIFLDLDTDRFWQLISNLIFNAIKFTHRNGEVKVSVTREMDKCLIKIKDSGIGISKSMLPYIFDKFTKAKRKGTDGETTYGIGLSIVKRLTELHKGEISVESECGKGSTFSLVFPLSTN